MTEVVDELWLEHCGGAAGAASRLLFCDPALRVLFAYRAHRLRRYAEDWDHRLR